MSIENSETSKQANNTPKKHTGWRVGLAGLVGFLGTLGGVSACKPLEQETSKQNLSAQSQQIDGKIPSQKAFEELVGTSTATPEATSTATVTKTLEPTSTPTPTETPSPTPTPEAKPLPEVISNQTVKFTTPPVEEVQKIDDELKSKGEFKINLPETIKDNNLSVQEVHAKNGHTLLAITASHSQEGTYNFPVLSGGKVRSVRAGVQSNFSSLGVSIKDNEVWFYFFPAPGQAFLKEGETAKIGQEAISANYNPNTQNGQIFTKFLETQIGGDVPSNTVVLIGKSLSKSQGLDLTFKDINITPQGEIVLVGSSTK